MKQQGEFSGNEVLGVASFAKVDGSIGWLAGAAFNFSGATSPDWLVQMVSSAPGRPSGAHACLWGKWMKLAGKTFITMPLIMVLMSPFTASAQAPIAHDLWCAYKEERARLQRNASLLWFGEPETEEWKSEYDKDSMMFLKVRLAQDENLLPFGGTLPAGSIVIGGGPIPLAMQPAGRRSYLVYVISTGTIQSGFLEIPGTRGIVGPPRPTGAVLSRINAWLLPRLRNAADQITAQSNEHLSDEQLQLEISHDGCPVPKAAYFSF